MAKQKTPELPATPVLDDSLFKGLDEVTGADPEPEMGDPAWSDFVLAHFEESELDVEGCPRVHGLRRVGRRLLGPVLKSISTVVQPPSFSTTADKSGFLPLHPTVVQHELVILWKRDFDVATPVEFTATADVWSGNADERFGRYMCALAGTRAESIAWRKALQLNKVSAEEKDSRGATTAFNADRIQPVQVQVIATKCSQLGVNVKKFVNAGKSRYAQFKDVPYDAALLMVQTISDYQRDPKKIPPGIRGYDPNWKQELGE